MLLNSSYHWAKCVSNILTASNKKLMLLEWFMPEAFVLFKTLPARERDVYQTLSNHDSVVEVHALYGEYDLLVRVSSEDSGKLSGMLMSDFRQIDGVKDTQTMIAVEY